MNRENGHTKPETYIYKVNISACAITIIPQFYPKVGFCIQMFIGFFIIIWTNSGELLYVVLWRALWVIVILIVHFF